MSSFPVARSTCLIALLLICGSGCMNAQTQSSRFTVTPNVQIPTEQSPALQQPLVAPFFVEDGEFSSTLILLNGTAVPTYADVALHAPDGTTVAKQRIQFTPHSQQQLSISSLRANGTEPNITTGSITVSQDSKPSGMTIVGGLAISQTSTNTHHFIDEELAMPMLAMPGVSNSQMLRGVADSSNGSPLVAIASLTTVAQHVSILCVSGTQTQTSMVTVVPGQSLLVPACGTAPNSGADLHWYETNMPHKAFQAVGISLTTDGVPGSFAAFGLAPHNLPEGIQLDIFCRSEDAIFFAGLHRSTGWRHTLIGDGHLHSCDCPCQLLQ